PAYHIGGEFGRGGFGLVMAGRHLALGRDVAIKVLSTRAGGEGMRSRFRAEAEVMASLDHPHVVRVYDYHEDADLCLIIMEQLAGGELTGWMGRPLAAPTVCAVGVAIAEALPRRWRAPTRPACYTSTSSRGTRSSPPTAS
ncbi:MAG TPA: protein kinase, partial [Frankiaceae bacterium]|nr:protein kinase [Frankiaceae bacterium]